WGYDDQMNVVEMKSSYQLKAGETGYNGIDSYEYVEGLGHLDACNGHFGPTPDFPQGIYHYHTTMQNGNGDMGFPYFLICYHGEADMSSDAGTGQGGGDCDGYGETWGPGIGPPPPGCEGGPGAQSEISQISTELVFDPTVLIIFGLCLATAFWLRRNRNHP
ncbi:MAG: YHYH protein, partial [Candidatus Poseidoniaceae archaeon]